MLSLFGGLAAASVGGMGLAQAAGPALSGSEDLAPALKAGLDKADADFSQVVVRRTTVVRRPRRVVHRTVVRRPGRPVVVRRTVVVRRPRRVVVRRRVIYR
jgi:hypothetical protein